MMTRRGKARRRNEMFFEAEESPTVTLPACLHVSTSIVGRIVRLIAISGQFIFGGQQPLEQF